MYSSRANARVESRRAPPAHPVVLGVLSNWAAANCSIDQRIDLSQAGYDKAEIERLCTQSSQAAPAAPQAGATAAPWYALMGKGSIVGGKASDYAQRRCVAIEAAVLFPRKGLVPYAQLKASTLNKIDREDLEILLHLGVDSGFNAESCIIMRVDTWRYRDDPARLEADRSRYLKEYETTLGSLRQRGLSVQ